MTGDELDRYRNADGSLVVSEDDLMDTVPYTAKRIRALRTLGDRMELVGRILLYVGTLVLVGLGALALYGWPSSWED